MELDQAFRSNTSLTSLTLPHGLWERYPIIPNLRQLCLNQDLSHFGEVEPCWCPIDSRGYENLTALHCHTMHIGDSPSSYKFLFDSYLRHLSITELIMNPANSTLILSLLSANTAMETLFILNMTAFLQEDQKLFFNPDLTVDALIKNKTLKSLILPVYWKPEHLQRVLHFNETLRFLTIVDLELDENFIQDDYLWNLCPTNTALKKFRTNALDLCNRRNINVIPPLSTFCSRYIDNLIRLFSV